MSLALSESETQQPLFEVGAPEFPLVDRIEVMGKTLCSLAKTDLDFEKLDQQVLSTLIDQNLLDASMVDNLRVRMAYADFIETALNLYSIKQRQLKSNRYVQIIGYADVLTDEDKVYLSSCNQAYAEASKV